MADPRITNNSQPTYRLKEGRIEKCLPGKEACEIMPTPKSHPEAKATFVYQSNNELFAILDGIYSSPCASITRTTTAGHFRNDTNDWDIQLFGRITSMNAVQGSCQDKTYIVEKMETEDDHLIITLNNGEQHRSKIIPGEMKYVPHSKKIDPTASIEDALEEIGDSNIGSPAIQNRWEKKHAIEYLKGKQRIAATKEEKANFQTAIDLLETEKENDLVVFLPAEPNKDENYCDGLGCRPILRKEPYYREHTVSTMGVINIVPFLRDITISDTQWNYVVKPFENGAKSAEDEREILKEVVRRWELILASEIGTGNDIGGWPGNVVGLVNLFGFTTGQTNCNDEMMNMATLLQGLERGNFLKYHKIPYEDTLASLWGMHQAVKIIEEGTGEEYIVDAWPKGNAQPPIITREKDWNFITANSLEIWPESDGISQTPFYFRLSAGALGFEASRRYMFRQVGSRAMAIGMVMPLEEANVFFSEAHANPWLKPYATKHLEQMSWRVPVFRGEMVTVGDGSPAYVRWTLRSEFANLLPKKFIEGKTEFGELLVTPIKTSIKNPVATAAAYYMLTPRGMINSAALILFGLQLASVPFAGMPDGVPDHGDETEPSTLDLILTYGGMAYLGGEGYLAISEGALPLAFELPLAVPASIIGYIPGKLTADAIGKATGIETLEINEPGNEAVGITSGILSYHGIRKLLGEAVWEGVKKRTGDLLVKTIGVAGEFLETQTAKAIPPVTNFIKTKAIPAVATGSNAALGGLLLVAPLLLSGSDEEDFAMMMAGNGEKPDLELKKIIKWALIHKEDADIDWYQTSLLDSGTGGVSKRGKLFVEKFVPFANAKLKNSSETANLRNELLKYFPELKDIG